MLTNMLGGGMLSELVVNPFGVAKNIGVPLEDLGINKTDFGTPLDLPGMNGTSKAAFKFLDAL